MKIINCLQLIFAVFIISLGILYSNYERLSLSMCKKEGKAVVVDKYKIYARGYFMKYEYLVGGEYYSTSESLTKKKEVSYFKIGDTIDIYYGCGNSNISKFKEIVD